MEKIAVLLTCHNRKKKTIICLKSLNKAIACSSFKITFEIYLVDDGSIDGTSEEVSFFFPQINIIRGNGALYWAGGMRLAWKTAMSKYKYDAFLLLNDDVQFEPYFLNYIFQSHIYCIRKYHKTGIYVCSTIDPDTKSITYGGRIVKRKWIRRKTMMVAPTLEPISCSLGNANIMLVTNKVVEKIGILNAKYIHGIADYDYTLTAVENRIPVLLCPGIGGICRYDHGISRHSGNVKLKKRIAYLYSPTGLEFKEYMYYVRRHFPLSTPYLFAMLWLKTIFPFIWNKFKKQPGFVYIQGKS